jgi:hypothetical protein
MLPAEFIPLDRSTDTVEQKLVAVLKSVDQCLRQFWTDRRHASRWRDDGGHTDRSRCGVFHDWQLRSSASEALAGSAQETRKEALAMPLWTPAGYSAWDTATDLGGVTPDVVAAGPTLGGLIGGVGVGFSAGSLAGMGVQSLLGKTGARHQRSARVWARQLARRANQLFPVWAPF